MTDQETIRKMKEAIEAAIACHEAAERGETQVFPITQLREALLPTVETPAEKCPNCQHSKHEKRCPVDMGSRFCNCLLSVTALPLAVEPRDFKPEEALTLYPAIKALLGDISEWWATHGEETGRCLFCGWVWNTEPPQIPHGEFNADCPGFAMEIFYSNYKRWMAAADKATGSEA